MSAPHAIDAYVSQKLSIKKRFIKIEKKIICPNVKWKTYPETDLRLRNILDSLETGLYPWEILQEICFAKPTSFLMSILLINQSTIPPTCTEVNHIAQTPAENQWHWDKVKLSLIVT